MAVCIHETDALPCSLAVLEMQLRQLKSHLKKRGLKCDKCLQRERHAMSEERCQLRESKAAVRP